MSLDPQSTYPIPEDTQARSTSSISQGEFVYEDAG